MCNLYSLTKGPQAIRDFTRAMWSDVDTGGREPSDNSSFSENDENGTTQRHSTPSHRRQCGDVTLRILVTPGSLLRPSMTALGDGIPQRALTSSRPSG